MCSSIVEDAELQARLARLIGSSAGIQARARLALVGVGPPKRAAAAAVVEVRKDGAARMPTIFFGSLACARAA